MSSASASLDTGQQNCPSSIGWIIGLIIAFLIAIGLGIWLLVLYLGGHVSSTDRLVVLPGASIRALENTVTGTWGALDHETDKVTLYVSQKPFVFDSTGQVVVGSSGTVLMDSQTGSNGKISIPVKQDTSYNAMMIVSGNGTAHYQIFGPKRVFTQVNSDLTGKLFNIRDLNSCNGAVSTSANYTTVTNNVGTFRLGSSTNTNMNSDSFIVQYNPEQQTETEQILCRVPAATQLTQVTYGTWINKQDSNATPIVCTLPNTDNNTTNCTAPGSTRLDISNCQWSYNTDPSDPNMAGLNQWCLKSTGPLTLNSSITSPLCLSINGSALNVVNGTLNPDTWFNTLLM